ncbi:uncharacterized mitochondrial protein-like protein [Tanacetum coccineum]
MTCSINCKGRVSTLRLTYDQIHEKNYTTHDLELGAVVFALKMWKHYLYRTREGECRSDALSRKERVKPLRVRALVMTIGLNLPKKILKAQTEALKPENLPAEDVGGSILPRLQEVEDLQGDDLLYYDAEMELTNMILLSIPNEIYNSVDSCKTAKEMWDRVERLMRGTIQNQVDRETRFTNEFDQFVAEPGESLVSVYNRFAQLMNDLERNNMKFPTVSQFEKLVNVSREKKLEKYHDPLALVAHTGSSSRNTSSYYVTHPTSVVDYEDEYHEDDVHTNSEDPLASAMLLLARAITQKFSTPTNNCLRTSSNTRNQAIIQRDRVNIQSMNSGSAGRNNRRAYVQEEIIEGLNAPNETKNVQRNCPKPRVRDSKYFMEQMLLAKQDEARVILTDEQNDVLFADASRMEEIEELSANICLMARIQPTDNTSDAGPSYNYAFISEVQSSSNNENKEQMYPNHTKIINNTISDDQINSDIIFDSPNGNVNSGNIEKDTHVPDLCALEQLARNAYHEAEKQ